MPVKYFENLVSWIPKLCRVGSIGSDWEIEWVSIHSDKLLGHVVEETRKSLEKYIKAYLGLVKWRGRRFYNWTHRVAKLIVASKNKDSCTIARRGWGIWGSAPMISIQIHFNPFK